MRGASDRGRGALGGLHRLRREALRLVRRGVRVRHVVRASASWQARSVLSMLRRQSALKQLPAHPRNLCRRQLPPTGWGLLVWSNEGAAGPSREGLEVPAFCGRRGPSVGGGKPSLPQNKIRVTGANTKRPSGRPEGRGCIQEARWLLRRLAHARAAMPRRRRRTPGRMPADCWSNFPVHTSLPAFEAADLLFQAKPASAAAVVTPGCAPPPPPPPRRRRRARRIVAGGPACLAPTEAVKVLGSLFGSAPAQLMSSPLGKECPTQRQAPLSGPSRQRWSRAAKITGSCRYIFKRVGCCNCLRYFLSSAGPRPAEHRSSCAHLQSEMTSGSHDHLGLMSTACRLTPILITHVDARTCM